MSRSDRPKNTPDDVSSVVRKLFERMHPGWTDEDLLNRPSECEHFCNVVRVKLRNDVDDYEITRFLMAKRKQGGHAFGKSRKGNVRLKTELRATGIDMEPADFVDRITEIFHGLCRNVTDESMLRHPKEAKAFCEAVRKNLGIPGLPERLICQTLVNRRKSASKAKV